VLGPVHLFVIDTDPAFDDAEYLEEQRAWLERAVSSSPAAWQVVALHDPPYSSGSDYGSEPLFQWPYSLWGVDLVLAGHEHFYERISRDGITYVVNGLGGAGRYPFAETPVGGSQVRYNANEGAVKLSASGSSLLLEMISVDGQVVDRHELPRVADPEFVAFQDGSAPTPAYAGTRDATIWAKEPNRTLGTLTWLRADGDDPPGSGKGVGALLAWDVGALPPGSTVLSASIVLEVTNPAEQQVYDVHAMWREWDERAVTWESFGDAPWEQSGGRGDSDRDPSPVGRLAATSLGRNEIRLDDRGVLLVQGWLDASTPAAGFMVASDVNSDGVEFHSREAADASVRPRLEVVYRPPAPPAVAPDSAAVSVPSGDAVDMELRAVGGTAPYRWSIVQGELPEGFSLSGAGVLNGRNDAEGDWHIEVVVTDSASRESAPTRIDISLARVVDGTVGGQVQDSPAFTRGAPIDLLVSGLVVVAVLTAIVVGRRNRPRDATAELS
jgi:hypothetical protein